MLKPVGSKVTAGDTQIPTAKFKMEKITWTDGVKNQVLHGVKEERNFLRIIK